ncbi:hypothetical protein INS49_007636 [Diaporthe citri]|uniref:uncharacterized protein n=1 Tax=Diaporthe citri TaxID=83186 RepID=UPI001C804E07|nr:uncharacterized protein INS49_007636 [Diaporthe citri]KAG6362544.1 hypothetical protein INS49_007636 [Diaporthe citri]
MDETIHREAQEIELSWQSFVGPWHPGTEPSDSFWKNVLGLWERAPNWHTMTELNRRYLQRRLPVCAGYGSPPDRETDSFMNLLRLHDYGIISTNSCPGWEDQLDDSPAFTRQRAYLNFSIPTRTLIANNPKALNNFIEKLMKSNELYAFIRFKYDNAPNGVQRDPQITKLMKFGYCCSFPDSASKEWKEEKWDSATNHRKEVTRYHVPQEQMRQDSQAWEPHGDIDVDRSGSGFDDDDDPFPASRAEDPLQISVFAKDWSYREIGQLIEGHLIDSGIVPGFVAGG